MITDKIMLEIREIAKWKSRLKDMKKEISKQKKVDTEEYLELKKALKDLRDQVKTIEKDWENELMNDENSFYNKLRREKIEAEEKIAIANERFFKLVAELPAKPFNLKVETESGPVMVQAQPEMTVYFNGKAEKNRTA